MITAMHVTSIFARIGSRCAGAIGAACLLAGVTGATPQELLGQALQFEGWAEDLRPRISHSGSLSSFERFIEHDVLGFRIEYSTTYRGEQITVSGLVVFPLDLDSAAPILVWNHGTILDEEGAPSSWKSPLQLQLMPALNGMITFMPDYVGYGASADLVHPYILQEDLVPSVIDMIHAGREFLEEEGVPFSDELHVWGFSEGGYVALATARELDTNADHGLTVSQVNAVSGPYDILETVRLVLSDESYPTPAYAALIIAAYNERYWQRSPAEFFRSPHADLVARFLSRETGLISLAGSMPETVGQLMSPNFTARFEGDGEKEFKAAFEANSVAPWAPGMPVFLYHGTADRDVPFAVGDRQHKAMLAAGADPERLSFVRFEGADHSATVYGAVRTFFDRRTGIPSKTRVVRPSTPPGWQQQLNVAQSPTVSEPWTGYEDERLWGREDDWEPALAADRLQARVFQLTTRYNPSGGGPGSPNPAMIFRRSLDGGATFEGDSFIDAVAAGQNDPQLAVADDGTLHAVWIEGFVPGVQYSRSVDDGDTWSAPIAVAQGPGPPNWSDKPILTIAPDGQDVYIAFNASDSWVVSSHDAGLSFSSPLRTSSDTRYWFHSAGVVAPNKEVLFAATDYSQSYAGDSHVNVIRSTDGGLSWISTRVDTSSEMPDCPWAPGCTFGFLGPSAALSVDQAGTFLLAYHAGDIPGSAQRMWTRNSSDGVTWSPRLDLSDAGLGSNHAFPSVAAGSEADEFHVLWQDDRNGTGFWNTWLRRSVDGGQTWFDEVRLSNLSSGAPYKSALGYSFPYGDYNAIDVGADGKVHAAWGEGASWNGPGGVWFTRAR